MSEHLKQAVRELEDEVRQLQQAIFFLKQRMTYPSANGTAGNPRTSENTALTPDLFRHSNFARLKNQDAVDLIFREAETGCALTVNEIIAEGKRRGRAINPNTVRWVVSGPEGRKKYRHHNVPGSNAKAYSLIQTVKEEQKAEK